MSTLIEGPQRAKTASEWRKLQNLRLRPHAPATGRGRLQRQIRRCFIALGPVVSSSKVYDWSNPRNRRHMTQRHRHSVWRILNEIAEPVGHSRGPGRPWLWRLRDDPALTAPTGASVAY